MTRPARPESPDVGRVRHWDLPRPVLSPGVTFKPNPWPDDRLSSKELRQSRPVRPRNILSKPNRGREHAAAQPALFNTKADAGRLMPINDFVFAGGADELSR